MVENQTEQKWNFDGAEYELIFQIKQEITLALHNWDLNGAYNSIRTFRREIDAMLSRETIKKNKTYNQIKQLKAEFGEFEDSETEENEINFNEKYRIDLLMGKVEESRNIFIKSKKTDEEKTKYYLNLEYFYMELCAILKKHRAYFREDEAYDGL